MFTIRLLKRNVYTFVGLNYAYTMGGIDCVAFVRLSINDIWLSDIGYIRRLYLVDEVPKMITFFFCLKSCDGGYKE